MAKKTWIKIDDGAGDVPRVYSEPSRKEALSTARELHEKGYVGRVVSLYAADPAKVETEPFKILGVRAARLQS